MPLHTSALDYQNLTMLTIATSVIAGFFASYFIARSKCHWLLVVLSVFSSLALFLLIFFGTHIIFLGILQAMSTAVETRSILGLGKFILAPREWAPWIAGLGVLIAVFGSGIGWAKAKERNDKRS
tara:strand:+ start:294 stop:668 length:375 start_codon:yes stop_codon:yes gene_type:complete